MDNFALKKEIKQRIDGEDNPEVLKAIVELLFSEENDPIYKEKLISRALKADEDIAAWFLADLDKDFLKVALLLT